MTLLALCPADGAAPAPESHGGTRQQLQLQGRPLSQLSVVPGAAAGAPPAADGPAGGVPAQAATDRAPYRPMAAQQQQYNEQNDYTIMPVDLQR